MLRSSRSGRQNSPEITTAREELCAKCRFRNSEAEDVGSVSPGHSRTEVERKSELWGGHHGQSSVGASGGGGQQSWTPPARVQDHVVAGAATSQPAGR